MEYLEERRAYPDELASRLTMEPGTVASTLSRLRQVSKDYYVRSENDEENRVYYVLSVDHLVTFKETAQVLQMILEFPASERDTKRVPYNRFVSACQDRMGLPRKDIRNVICSAQKQMYLKDLTLNGRWLIEEPRLRFEAEYIRRLAGHFAPVASKGANGKKLRAVKTSRPRGKNRSSAQEQSLRKRAA